MPAPSVRFTAAEVPGLRRELAEWYGGPQGIQFYYDTEVLAQTLRLRKTSPPARVARHRSAAEATRLSDADLWYFDADLCALLADAHPSMPAFAPRPSDLPSQSGFAVFARPFGAYTAAETYRDGIFDDVMSSIGSSVGDKFRELADRAYHHQAPVVAVSWGPIPDGPAGGVRMSFYTTGFGDLADDDPKTAHRAATLPPLAIEHDAVIPWRPDGAPVDPYLLPTHVQGQAGIAWSRLVFAAFQLAAQANLAESEQRRTLRPERRRTARVQLPARDVRIIRLRRNLAEKRDPEPGATRNQEWRHRWIVRGHWRNQWYPSLGDHRPKWIAPYLKGPDDAPLLGGDKVTVAIAPPRQDQPDGTS